MPQHYPARWRHDGAGRRRVVLVAALLATLLTARLGVWQLDRAAQKNRLQARWKASARCRRCRSRAGARRSRAAAQEHRASSSKGNGCRDDGVPGQPPDERRTGFYAVTPLRLDDGSAVLVQRAGCRATPTTARASPRATAGNAVRVQGRIAHAPSRLYEFEAAASGPIRQNIDVDAYARETGLPLRPLTVLQEEGLRRPRTAAATVAPTRRRCAQALWLCFSWFR